MDGRVPYPVRMTRTHCGYCNRDHRLYGVEVHYTAGAEGFWIEGKVDEELNVWVGGGYGPPAGPAATDPDNFSWLYCIGCEMELQPEDWGWLPSAPPGEREGIDMIEKRCFQLVGGGHSKFWTVQVRGKYFFATWGRIGTAGQTQSKEFASSRAAMDHATKMIGEKTGKGYTEVAASKHAGAPDHLLNAAGGGGGSGGGGSPSRVTAPPDDEVQMRGLDL